MVTLPGGKAKHFHELDSYYKYSQDDSESGTFIFLSSGWAELELCKNQPCTRQVWCPHEWSSKELFVPQDQGFPLFLYTLRWSIAESKESCISAHVPVYGLDATHFLFKGNYADENTEASVFLPRALPLWTVWIIQLCIFTNKDNCTERKHARDPALSL